MVLPATTCGASTWTEWPSAGVACPATGAFRPARIPSVATLKTIRVITTSPSDGDLGGTAVVRVSIRWLSPGVKEYIIGMISLRLAPLLLALGVSSARAQVPAGFTPAWRGVAEQF